MKKVVNGLLCFTLVVMMLIVPNVSTNKDPGPDDRPINYSLGDPGPDDRPINYTIRNRF